MFIQEVQVCFPDFFRKEDAKEIDDFDHFCKSLNANASGIKRN